MADTSEAVTEFNLNVDFSSFDEHGQLSSEPLVSSDTHTAMDTTVVLPVEAVIETSRVDGNSNTPVQSSSKDTGGDAPASTPDSGNEVARRLFEATSPTAVNTFGKATAPAVGPITPPKAPAIELTDTTKKAVLEKAVQLLTSQRADLMQQIATYNAEAQQALRYKQRSEAERQKLRLELTELGAKHGDARNLLVELEQKVADQQRHLAMEATDMQVRRDKLTAAEASYQQRHLGMQKWFTQGKEQLAQQAQQIATSMSQLKADQVAVQRERELLEAQQQQFKVKQARFKVIAEQCQQVLKQNLDAMKDCTVSSEQQIANLQSIVVQIDSSNSSNNSTSDAAAAMLLDVGNADAKATNNKQAAADDVDSKNAGDKADDADGDDDSKSDDAAGEEAEDDDDDNDDDEEADEIDPRTELPYGQTPINFADDGSLDIIIPYGDDLLHTEMQCSNCLNADKPCSAQRQSLKYDLTQKHEPETPTYPCKRCKAKGPVTAAKCQPIQEDWVNILRERLESNFAFHSSVNGNDDDGWPVTINTTNGSTETRRIKAKPTAFNCFSCERRGYMCSALGLPDHQKALQYPCTLCANTKHADHCRPAIKEFQAKWNCALPVADADIEPTAPGQERGSSNFPPPAQSTASKSSSSVFTSKTTSSPNSKQPTADISKRTRDVVTVGDTESDLSEDDDQPMRKRVKAAAATRLPFTTPSTANSSSTSTSAAASAPDAPIKRPRGRPRKHPLPATSSSSSAAKPLTLSHVGSDDEDSGSPSEYVKHDSNPNKLPYAPGADKFNPPQGIDNVQFVVAPLSGKMCIVRKKYANKRQNPNWQRTASQACDCCNVLARTCKPHHKNPAGQRFPCKWCVENQYTNCPDGIELSLAYQDIARHPHTTEAAHSD
jgi:hypothetical protein